jgi:hypothetical protein
VGGLYGSGSQHLRLLMMPSGCACHIKPPWRKGIKSLKGDVKAIKQLPFGISFRKKDEMTKFLLPACSGKCKVKAALDKRRNPTP